MPYHGVGWGRWRIIPYMDTEEEVHMKVSEDILGIPLEYLLEEKGPEQAEQTGV